MPKKRKNYLAPKNKKELIKYINEKGVADIVCTSTLSEGMPWFGIEIITKDEKKFSFTQDVKIEFGEIVVDDFSTGNGIHVIDLGKTFDAQSYYKDFKEPKWKLEIDPDVDF